MGGYIVLCDHNSKWAEKFTDEAIKRNIQTVVVESIAEIEDKLTADGSSIMLVCSLIELREYLKNNTDTKEIELKRKKIIYSIEEIEKIEITFINFKTFKIIWKVK